MEKTEKKSSTKKSAVILLAEMEAAHKEKVKEIKEKAADEIRAELKTARASVKELEDELEALTGLGGKAGSGSSAGGKRARLSSAVIDEVGLQLLKHLDKKTETNKGVLAEKTGQDKDMVTAALNKLAREKKAKSNGKVGKAGAWLLL